MQNLIKYASDRVRRLAEGKHTKNIAFSAAGAVANPALQLLATPYLFKHLGAVEFGIWALINSLLSAASVASFGLGESATKFVAKALAEDDSALAVRVARGVLTIYGALGIITPLFVAFAAPWIAGHFFDLKGDGVTQGVMWVQIACLGLFFRFIYGVFESVARGYHRYDTEAVYGTASTLATTVAALLCVFVGLGLTAILICSVGVLFASTIGLAAACARLASSWRVVFPTLNLSVMKPLMPFSLFAWLQSVNGFGLHTCDRFIVGYFLGPAAVGFYSACLQLVQTLHFILARAFGFLFPAVVKAHAEGNQTEMLGLFRKSLLATTAFGIAGSGFVICFSYDILRLWMGTEFAIHSSATLAILALWNLILSTTVPQFYFLNAAGQERINTAFGFLSSIIAVGTSLVLVPIIGERGAALGRLASSTIGVFSRQVVLRRLFSGQVSPIAGYITIAVPWAAGCALLIARDLLTESPSLLAVRILLYFVMSFAGIWLLQSACSRFLAYKKPEHQK